MAQELLVATKRVPPHLLNYGPFRHQQSLPDVINDIAMHKKFYIDMNIEI